MSRYLCVYTIACFSRYLHIFTLTPMRTLKLPVCLLSATLTHRIFFLHEFECYQVLQWWCERAVDWSGGRERCGRWCRGVGRGCVVRCGRKQEQRVGRIGRWWCGLDIYIGCLAVSILSFRATSVSIVILTLNQCHS